MSNIKYTDWDPNTDYIRIIKIIHDSENKKEKIINEQEKLYLKLLNNKNNYKILNKLEAKKKYNYIDNDTFGMLYKNLPKLESFYNIKKCFWCNCSKGKLISVLSYLENNEYFVVYSHTYQCY
jgi:redox-regulated HSP33 family molecular chaperone